MTNNEVLKEIRDSIGGKVRAWQIRDALQAKGIMMDESTIRGKFMEMGEPLTGQQVSTQGKIVGGPKIKPPPREIIKPAKTFSVADDMKQYIPEPELFTGYIERPIDKRLAVHYDSGKYPITQGKQGTGKTFSHMYYAFKNQIPFLLFNGHKDFKLRKYFGDKTIKNGSICFQENMFVKAIQCVSCILFDEVNNIEETIDYHAFLQNRQLFIKDADDGKGRTYKVHPDCRIGFAQNPKSAKYIGGKILPSNFLGRCTYISYPEFTKQEIQQFVTTKFTTVTSVEASKFVEFYFACSEAIEKAELPVDISIRQLNNIIDLYTHGLTLQHAIEDGLTSILDAISQPKNKEAFFRLAQAVFKSLMDKSIDENVGEIK